VIPNEQASRRCGIRLMTWNIHGGVGPDRRFDLERIAVLVARHQPDIIALQEIDTRGRGPRCLAPLRRLGHSDGELAEAKTIVAPDGHYGHALFSRWPIRDVSIHDLSIGSLEPRSAIEATITTALGLIQVFAVHLGLNISERRGQARRLAKMALQSQSKATVMMGDFNDWFSFGAVRRSLATVLPARTTIATFPARRPTLKLDRIYCSVPDAIERSWTDIKARHCSDHLPVIADLSLDL
jgi:endonuclease/exonuclease/phosphatase family metal-dependent hydrolase